MPNVEITLRAVPGLPAVQPGDDLAALIRTGLAQAELPLRDGDVLVVSSKIVSKAEGRYVDLVTVTPSEQARDLAQQTRKDPRLVELVLQHSAEISRSVPHVLIVRHHLGFVSANAGIDASNVGAEADDTVLLLPQDPDANAAALRAALLPDAEARLGVIISDTHGRPFRLGNVGVAIGAAGLPVLIDQRGEHDLFGRELLATMTPLADELAAAAGLISGQADEGQPVVLIRGVAWQASHQTARDLLRSADKDLYLR